MSRFIDIPKRGTASNFRIEVPWFDTLRAAGVTLENLLGGGNVSGDQALDNGAAATDITDLAFDGDTYTSVIIDYEAQRSDGSETRFTNKRVILQFVSGSWRVRELEAGGEPDGITWSITTDGDNVGQLKYATDNMTGGSYSGEIKYKAFTFAA